MDERRCTDDGAHQGPRKLRPSTERPCATFRSDQEAFTCIKLHFVLDTKLSSPNSDGTNNYPKCRRIRHPYHPHSSTIKGLPRQSTQRRQDATLQQTRRRRRSLKHPKPPSSTTNPRPRITASATQSTLATLTSLSARKPQTQPTHPTRAIQPQLSASTESASQSAAPESRMAGHSRYRLHSQCTQSRYTVGG